MSLPDWLVMINTIIPFLYKFDGVDNRPDPYQYGFLKMMQ